MRVARPTFRYQVIGIPENGPVALTLTRFSAFLLRDALAANQPGEFTVCNMDGYEVSNVEMTAAHIEDGK